MAEQRDEIYDNQPKRMAKGESYYAYPKRKPFKVTAFMVIIVCSMVVGAAVGTALWKVWLQPTEHHMMYPDEGAAVAAKWTGEPIVVPAYLSNVVRNSSYYGTIEYQAMLPEERENGVIVFNPKSGSDMSEFVRLIRNDIDTLVEEDTNDTFISFFREATMSKDYDSLVVKTPMLKESLIDKSIGQAILDQMKIQSLLYFPGEDHQVVVSFVNDKTGETIVSLKS